MNKKTIILFVIALLSIVYWYFFLLKPNSEATKACAAIQQNDLEMKQYSASIDSTWEFTHQTIGASLPPDIDTLLRVRLTSLKQVKYITSYDYFKKMSPDLQQLIKKTGNQDSLIALKMRTIISTQADLQKSLFDNRTKLKKAFLGKYYLDKIQCQ
jgi:hypothetical protein